MKRSATFWHLHSISYFPIKCTRFSIVRIDLVEWQRLPANDLAKIDEMRCFPYHLEGWFRSAALKNAHGNWFGPRAHKSISQTGFHHAIDFINALPLTIKMIKMLTHFHCIPFSTYPKFQRIFPHRLAKPTKYPFIHVHILRIKWFTRCICAHRPLPPRCNRIELRELVIKCFWNTKIAIPKSIKEIVS